MTCRGYYTLSMFISATIILVIVYAASGVFADSCTAVATLFLCLQGEAAVSSVRCHVLLRIISSWSRRQRLGAPATTRLPGQYRQLSRHLPSWRRSHPCPPHRLVHFPCWPRKAGHGEQCFHAVRRGCCHGCPKPCSHRRIRYHARSIC